jgi:small subunit ribosomal protein S17
MGNRRQYTGEVISDKMQKTRIVKIVRMSKHPKYLKIVKKTVKFKVHDEKNESKTGDMVSIEETRPLSKDKRYKLIAITRKAKAAHVAIKEEAK